MRKKVQKRIPGGKTAVHTKKKKTSKHKCAVCRGLLHGTPRDSPVEIRRLAKTERSPSRPFGGQLCSKCSRIVIRLKAMVENKVIKMEDIPISLREYTK